MLRGGSTSSSSSSASTGTSEETLVEDDLPSYPASAASSSLSDNHTPRGERANNSLAGRTSSRALQAVELDEEEKDFANHEGDDRNEREEQEEDRERGGRAIEEQIPLDFLIFVPLRTHEKYLQEKCYAAYELHFAYHDFSVRKRRKKKRLKRDV